MNVIEQMSLQPGMKVAWDEGALDVDAWYGFIRYAGTGPFTLISRRIAPCTCRLGDGDMQMHAPGCLREAELDHYLTLSKPDGQLLTARDSDTPLPINAKFFEVVGLS